MALGQLIVVLLLGLVSQSVCSAPSVSTSLGVAEGVMAAEGVERFGGIPYAVPPLGALRFAPAKLRETRWPGGRLDAKSLGRPCINNPLGDPREVPQLVGDEVPPPGEDCLYLNIWRPSSVTSHKPLPVMVWNYGGGLCGGFAGNRYFNGSLLAKEHDVIVITVSYRLGALGFLVDDDFAGPGNGGMNGIRDTVIALRWIQRYIGAFGGDTDRVTLLGQSSGSYAACTLSVAPEAAGLFQRLILQSGPCFGGPPNRGWGPRNATYGRQVAAEIMAATNTTSLDELRHIPAENVQWPSKTMNDPSVAPYFSGYFEDLGFLPLPAEVLWKAGRMHPREVIVGHNSKDGTASFYGAAPTLGLVAPDKQQTSPADYEAAIASTWGANAEAILHQYPLTRFQGSPQKAFLQVDADSMVICPGYDVLKYARNAGRKVWSFEFAHYQPARWRADGFGCSNGAELDMTPPTQTNYTQLFALHGDEVKYVFGNEVGPDGLGPPNNRTICTFSSGERELSRQMRSLWTSFAASGVPQGKGEWLQYSGTPEEAVTLLLAEPISDGIGIENRKGLHAADCEFWKKLWETSGKTMVI